MPNKTIVLDIPEFQRMLGLKGFIGRWIAAGFFKILEIQKINDLQAKYPDITGPELAGIILKEVGINCEVPEEQLALIPKEGGFVTVSNHPIGSLDGILLLNVIGGQRPDFKILTTFLLALIPGLKDSFIPVDNLSKGDPRSVAGIRAAFGHMADGHPLGLFPSGEVSTYQPRSNRTAPGDARIVEDIPWKANIIKVIRNSGLPVVPVYFEGENSKFFHFLGRIHPRLRTVRLIHEMFNKKGHTLRMRIGKPIQPSELAALDVPSMGRYIRSRCYALSAQCAPHKVLGECHWDVEIAPHVPAEQLRAEIAGLGDKALFEAAGYRLYLLSSQEAPCVAKEIGVLREEAFRRIGEGTGQATDTDDFDNWYKHLVLWHIDNGEIAGAYRIGFGPEIVAQRGIEGLYTSSLVSYKANAEKYLGKCMELGRSFVAAGYQKEIHPLRLLFAGLISASLKCPEGEFYLGSVSISNDYPDFYKSLFVHYMLYCTPLEFGEELVEPSHPFVPDFGAVNPDDLRLTTACDIDRFNRLVGTISGGQYKVPVLIRKYINCGAKTACFNVDPDFSFSLDGIIFVRLKDFPRETLDSFIHGLPEELCEQIHKHFYGE